MNKDANLRNLSTPRPGESAGAVGELQFAVELWEMGRSRIERIVGRADSIEVATAIYEAAVREHPYRLVVLRRGRALVRATE